MKNNQPNSNCYLVVSKDTFEQQLRKLIADGEQLMNATNNMVEPHAHIRDCEAWEMRAKAILSNSFSVQDNEYVQDLPQAGLYDSIGSTGIADDFSAACQLLYKQVEYIKSLQANVLPYLVEQPKQEKCFCKKLFGRLFTLFLLFALSFGFSSQAWGTDSHFCLGGDPINGQWSKNTTYKISTGYGENNKYYIVVYMKNGDYFSLYQENAGDNTTKRYCPDSDVEVQPGNGGSQGSLHDNNDNCKSWKYVGETGYVKVCIDVNNKEYSPYVWVEKYQFLTDDLKDVLKGNKVQFYFGDQRGEGWRHLFTKSGHESEDRAWFAAAVRQGSCFVNDSDWGSFRWAPASVASVNYYLSDNDGGWDGLQIGESAVAGKAYMLYDNQNVKIAKGDNRSGASFNNASSTITRGTSASGLSATLSHQTSVINATNSIKYYITSDNFDNYNEFDPTNASGLDAGTYTVAAVVTDGNIYVKAATATLTVTEPTYSVTINNGDHGTVSPNGAQQVGASGMNLTVTPNDCYSHTGWNTTGGASVTDNKVTATSAGSITAQYSERFYLRGYLKDDSGNGGMPGWGNDAPFVYANSEFAVTRTLTAGKLYKFMIFDKTADKQKGCTDDTGNSVIPWNTAWTCDGDYQICFTANVNGDYKFVVEQNEDNPRIKVIPPSQTIDLYKDGSFLKTISATFGEAFNKNVLTLPADTAKTGYIFGGFGDKETSSSRKMVITDKLNYTKNNTYGTNNSANTWCWTETTLNAYAVYSAKTYTVTLPGGGGTNDQNGSIQVKFDSKTASSFVAPTKEGYGIRSTNAFCEDAELTQGVFTQQGGISNKTNTYLTNGDWTYDWTDSKDAPTIYTAWVAQQYTLTLDDNNGTSTTSTKTVTYDANTNLTQKVTIPAKTGQDFTGYWTNNNGTGTQLVGSNGYFLDEVTSYIKSGKLWGYADNLTIYAGWANHAYNITYKDQGGTNFSGDWGTTVHPTTHTYNTATTLIAAPDKTGYTFGGWFISSDCTGQAVTELGATAYTADITLYAKWNPIVTTITIDMNGGNNENQEISATYDAVLNIVSINQSNVTKTGYAFNGIYTAASNGSYIVDKDWNVRSSSTVAGWLNSTGLWKNPNTTATLYVQWNANEYTITLNNNGADSGKEGTANVMVTYDANTNLTTAITIPEKEGNTFSGYYIDDVQIIDAGGNFLPSVEGYTDASKNWKHAANVELLAKWTPNKQCSVTFGITNGTEVAEYGTLTAKVDDVEFTSGNTIASGKTIVLTWVNKDGSYSSGNAYTFGKWYDNEVIANANELTLTRVGSTGNVYSYTITDDISIYQAPTVNTYTITSHTVNPEGTGSVSAESWNVGPAVPCVVTATPEDGYKFTNWAVGSALVHSSAQGTLTTSPITVYSKNNDDNRTITANFEEITSALTTALNGFGTTAGQALPTRSVEAVGVATSAQITAGAAKAGYIFTGWTLTNCERTDGGADNATQITVKGLGNTEAATVTANYAEDLSTNWELHIWVGPGDDDWQTYPFAKKTGESTGSEAYYSINLNAGEHDMELKKDGSTYYKNSGRFEANNCTNWTFTTDANRGKIYCNVTGTYTFKVDYSDTYPIVSVIYPSTDKYVVTISADENGIVSPLGEQQIDAYGLQITATPDPGYRFKEWVTTGGVTVTNATSATTTAKATAAGTLQATFTTEGMIYFNKAGISNSWTGDVWVYFLNTSYWDSNLGSGSQGYTGHQMTKIGNSDIYYFDYQSESITPKQYIAFTDNRRDNYSNFEACQATYREDFKTCAPVFVARDYKEYKNTQAANGQAVYFSKGYWRTFQSTDPGYDIHIYNSKESGGEKTYGDFTSTSNLSNDFTFTTTLDGDHTYGFKISSCGGTWYGNQGTMTQDCNWEFDSEGDYKNNCGLTTTAAGEYKFTLSCTNGWLRVSVEYPLSEGDYRLAYEELDGTTITKLHPTHHIKAIHEDGTKKDTVSFFVEQKADAYIYLQKCTHIDGTNITWTNESGKKYNLKDFDQEAGVYNFTLTQTKNGGTITPEVAYLEPYEGPYYIRTDCAGGGWSSYNIKDNEMTQSDVLKRNMADKGEYDYYFVKWANANTNVKYCVANNYSEALTDSLEGDDVIGNDKQTLPADANIRFMWNSTTNQLERAYLNGSTKDDDRYLMLIGNSSNETGVAHIYNTETTPARFTGDEVKLEDKGNWTYQIDIKADVTARGKLTTNYNNHIQYFKGSDGEFAEETTEQIIGGTDNTKKYGIRIVYDFKTNNMVAGWMPTSNVMPINESLAIYADVILVRHAQENAQTITFSGSGALTDVKTIYSAIELRKDSMVGRLSSWTPYAYSVCNYYVSFPYDVKISEIFGLGDYGKNWQMQYYDGAKRAKIGWFAETKTFWTTLSENDTLKAHEGYLLQLNKNELNKPDGAIWNNTKDHASTYIYFPSTTQVGGLSQQNVTITVPDHECKIDRTFLQDDGKPEEQRRNHKITDSHWNMIGLPVFQDVKKGIVEAESFTENLHYVYQWGIEDYTKIVGKNDNRTNTMEIVSTDDNFTFKAMHGYMVQYYGDITWTGAAITPAHLAPAKLTEENQNYKIDLQVLNNKGTRVSRTYVELAEDASDDFQFNEDVYMVANSTDAAIYSFAGSYDVAANVLSVKNHTIPLGIEVKKTGTYTIHVPNHFDGVATLIDYVANTQTLLNVDDYDVYLEEGTCEGRFALILDVEKKTTTAIDEAGDSRTNHALKYFENNFLYIQHGNHVFNANGMRVK